LTYYKVLPTYLPTGTKENLEKPVGIAGLWAKNQIQEVLNMTQKSYLTAMISWC